MTRRRAVAGLIGVAVLLYGAYWYWLEWTGPYAKQIRELRYADVEADVTVALAAGDRRYVGVMGYGLHTPGAPVHIDDDDVRVIPNTSDCTSPGPESWLQEVAAEYAEAYNRALKRRLLE